MINIARSTSGKNIRGFTLLELLLSVVLLSLLMAGMYRIFNGWSENAINRVAASDMLRLQSAAEDYVTANFDAFKNDAPNQFVEIDVADLTNGGFLPAAYTPLNGFKQRMRIFRRNVPITKLGADGNPVIDPSTGLNEIIITTEVMTLSDNPTAGDPVRIIDKRLLDAANAGGPKMGVVSTVVLAGKNFSGLATSAFNSWQVDLSDLSAAGYTTTANNDGGYLAVYGLVNTEAIDPNSEWLYRVAINNRPELNRMETNLRMNGNRLENVGTIVADKVSVTGNAAFRGKTQGAASQTAQAMTVEQALRVEGAGESRLNMKDTRDTVPAACQFTDVGGGNRAVGTGCQIGGGELQVISPTGDTSLAINNLISDGNVVTDVTDVENTATINGISTFRAVNATTDMTSRGTVLAPTINVATGTVTTEQLQTATMTAPAGATITNRLVAAEIAPTTLTTTSMDAVNAVNLKGDMIVGGINATESLFIDNISDQVGSNGYQDSVLNRRVSCSVVGSRTYCEPRGWTDWSNNVSQLCYDDTPTSYKCDYYKPGRTVLFGSCTFTRGVSSDGRSIHVGTCT